MCLTSKLANYLTKKLNKKSRGSALLISVFLSGLMLTVGIMSARLAVQEAQMSADLFLSERAYLSAESGVERALWKLKQEPLAHVEPTADVELGNTETTVSINNLIDTTADNFANDSFSFTLPHLASQKFQFRKDNDVSVTTTPDIINGSVEINLTPPGDVFWRFLCQDTNNQTQALQGRINGASTINNLTAEAGSTDDGASTTFNSWQSATMPVTGAAIADPQKDTCYLAIQNLNTADTKFTITGTTMAPHAAQIHAVGEHQGRQKHIKFNYAQKTLGALFDFSFLHSEGGL